MCKDESLRVAGDCRRAGRGRLNVASKSDGTTKNWLSNNHSQERIRGPQGSLSESGGCGQRLRDKRCQMAPITVFLLYTHKIPPLE